MSTYESHPQDLKGVNGPGPVAACFVCRHDYDIREGDIEVCRGCNEFICVNCRKAHEDACGEDCLS